MHAPEISSYAAARRASAHAQHAVQFYEEEDFLFDRVADFIAGGIHASENVVLIATRPHRSGFDERLGLRGFDVAGLAATGRVIWMDARETLSLFMSANGPDEQRFLAHIGDVFQRASAFGHSEAADRIRAAGFDAQAKKPIDPLPFARLIAEVSGRPPRV